MTVSLFHDTYLWLRIRRQVISDNLLFRISIISKILDIRSRNWFDPNDLKTHHIGRQFNRTDGFTVDRPAVWAIPSNPTF